ncbi:MULTISPECIES: hypothetical protein [unclassified Rhizobacter]|uniref:hypothetical protein n=1 Tax=unclassified Rhizobacter TaxID=2640088 RepID=UPI0006F681BA|nr:MULTISPECIES: hypothetical protein [unclassified Rhizobacter]KQU65065.1 hypothetical protein ASC88_11780 [Rhizobacter sp. Root29]KQW02757.1 hypothetical protein ASC98_27980 [Rhizobacter sp. Root1238]KRB15575.1 hypothetical protein ASE08_26955 [Rhizobacter sp. Root16D2]
MLQLFTRRSVTAALAFIAAFSSPIPAMALESVSGQVKRIGCHYTDNTCFVALDSANFGASLGCANPGTEFRFDGADTPAGKRAYASFLAAYLSQRTVGVVLDGCSAQGYPALRYFNLL